MTFELTGLRAGRLLLLHLGLELEDRGLTDVFWLYDPAFAQDIVLQPQSTPR